MEKSDFCGRQFGVQKPQQKPVSPQRASPVQEHVRTYMLAGRGEQLVVALQNHGNPAVCKTCRVPAETIETCTIFCPAAKILPTKRPPFWGPFLDPKTGAKSPGHKQIKLRLNEWTPFWGPFLDPKTGVVLSAKLWSPSEKKHKFRLFLHVRDRSFPYRWVSRALQRREYLFSTPCEHLCPHMFLNSSRACADIHACRAWRTLGRGGKIMETQRYAKPVVYPRKQSKLALFFARRQKFCRQNDPRFGIQKRTPKRGPSRPDTSKSN